MLDPDENMWVPEADYLIPGALMAARSPCHHTSAAGGRFLAMCINSLPEFARVGLIQVPAWCFAANGVSVKKITGPAVMVYTDGKSLVGEIAGTLPGMWARASGRQVDFNKLPGAMQLRLGRLHAGGSAKASGGAGAQPETSTKRRRRGKRGKRKARFPGAGAGAGAGGRSPSDDGDDCSAAVPLAEAVHFPTCAAEAQPWVAALELHLACTMSPAWKGRLPAMPRVAVAALASADWKDKVVEEEIPADYNPCSLPDLPSATSRGLPRRPYSCNVRGQFAGERQTVGRLLRLLDDVMMGARRAALIKFRRAAVARHL